MTSPQKDETMSILEKLPPDATGLKLHKIVGNKLISCETVMFEGGRAAVDTVLRRAALSGRVEVEPEGDLPDYFADIYTTEDDWDASVALDRNSYRSLKNHWMRCRVERYPDA